MKHNITKNADLRKTFENSNGEEKLIHNNPILSAVIKNHLQSYDPRSPTQEFERTPIIIASKIEDFANDKKLLQQNKYNYGSPCLRKDDSDENYDSCAEAQESPDIMVPKNLCNGFLDMTLNETLNDTDEPLGSSTASNEAIENNISNRKGAKATQLLETSFDYVETDQIACNKEEAVDDEPKYDLEHIPVYKILNEDPRSPTAEIERTPIVVAKCKDTNEDNVEDMSDDTLIKVLQTANSGLRQSVRSCDGIEGGLLIYEDEYGDMLDTLKKSKSRSNSGSRTPLSCMKNKEGTHTRSKSAKTVQDPKNQAMLPTKNVKRVSQIPRLKCLTKSSKLTPSGDTVSLKNAITKLTVLGVDCENTPPHSHRDRWDQDNSIVL